MFIWILTVTLANPLATTEPQAVAASTWSTEKDCLQALKLEKKIASFERLDKKIRCGKAEVVEQDNSIFGQDEIASMLDEIIVERVSKNWKQPEALPKGKSVEIQIDIDRLGRITGAKIMRSSGVNSLDSSALQAVMKTGEIPEISTVDSKTYKDFYSKRKFVFRTE